MAISLLESAGFVLFAGLGLWLLLDGEPLFASIMSLFALIWLLAFARYKLMLRVHDLEQKFAVIEEAWFTSRQNEPPSDKQ